MLLFIAWLAAPRLHYFYSLLLLVPCVNYCSVAASLLLLLQTYCVLLQVTCLLLQTVWLLLLLLQLLLQTTTWLLLSVLASEFSILLRFS